MQIDAQLYSCGDFVQYAGHHEQRTKVYLRKGLGQPSWCPVFMGIPLIIKKGDISHGRKL